MDKVLCHVRRHRLLLLASFFVLGGTSYAGVNSISGPDGVIHACYRKAGGAVRVVPAHARCSRRERTLSWNQQGRPGQAGLPGPTGNPGPKGDPGPSGNTGTTGPFPDPLPSGQTLRGAFALTDSTGTAGTAAEAGVSFGFTLPTVPTVIYVTTGTTAPQCPGTPPAPAAQPGYLCIYEASANKVSSFRGEFDPVTQSPNVATRFGFGVYAAPSASGTQFGISGTWAVTPN